MKESANTSSGRLWYRHVGWLGSLDTNKGPKHFSMCFPRVVEFFRAVLLTSGSAEGHNHVVELCSDSELLREKWQEKCKAEQTKVSSGP